MISNISIWGFDNLKKNDKKVAPTIDANLINNHRFGERDRKWFVISLLSNSLVPWHRRNGKFLKPALQHVAVYWIEIISVRQRWECLPVINIRYSFHLLFLLHCEHWCSYVSTFRTFSYIRRNKLIQMIKYNLKTFVYW